MSNNYLESDNDLFGIDLPTVDPDGSINNIEPPETVSVVSINDKVIDYVHNHTLVSYSVIGFAILLLFILLILAIKRIIIKNRNPMAEYTKQQIRRSKQQAYVSSSNKLETPDNLMECIRAFLDRTK